MPYPQFNRHKLQMKPLAGRKNRVFIERDSISPDAAPRRLSRRAATVIRETVKRVKKARKNDRPVILAFGAHTIKNGLAPVLIQLMKEGHVTHLATNGAGIIHDWEFAFLGESSENVRENVQKGEFGMWQETGKWINLAIIVGAWEGLGYGESVGALVENEGLRIPDPADLKDFLRTILDKEPDKCAAAADLYGVIREFKLKPGFLSVPHPHKHLCVQAAAYRLKIPFTGHPMIGHDIIYNHPMNHGGAIGRTAVRDWLTFAQSISRLDGGVYLSVGSSVMSPMIFEKAFSAAQNLSIQKGTRIEDHMIVVVDIADVTWDWQKKGEPPDDHPAYYMRYCKTFSRMGGDMRYACADNRDFLLALYQGLKSLNRG